MPLLDPAIGELNLSFLHLLRESLLRNRLLALSEFDIDDAVADQLLALSHEQLRRLAQSKVVLVALRWRRPAVWHCLADYACGTATALPQALLVAESEVCDGYQA